MIRNSASKSRSSLCRWMMKPPHLHIIVWSMLKDSPHTHFDWLSLKGQSYLNFKPSLILRLFKVKPISNIGITVNQVKCPLSEANYSIDFTVCDADLLMTSAFSFRASFFSFLTICFSFCILDSSGDSCVCAWICSTSGAVTVVDAA